MARYVPLGHRISTRLGRLFDAMSHFPPYKWSEDILRRLGFTGRSVVVAIPWIWLLLFFLIPFIIVLKISFADTRLGVPPYTDLVSWGATGTCNCG